MSTERLAFSPMEAAQMLGFSRLTIYRWKADRHQEGAGRQREMGLGSLLSVPASLAREWAQEARQALAGGLDPIEARRACGPVQRPTFGAAYLSTLNLNQSKSAFRIASRS